MISFFSQPKPFQGEFDSIQRKAILSWINLKPQPELILFSDEKNTAKIIAEEINAIYIQEVKKNEFGTPLISDIFEKAQKIAKNDILCYINCDIILMSDFVKAIDLIKNEDNFLMVGQRWDLDLKEEINFKDPEWEKNLKEKIYKEGRLHPPTGIDYFVFRKGTFSKIPSFAIGRTTYDEWLLWYVWKRKGKIIDATNFITAIHQNHSYINFAFNKEYDPWRTKEAKINLKLAGGYHHCLTIADANYTLTNNGLKKKSMPFSRKLELLPFIGLLVRQRKKIINLFRKFNV
ncbi:MAG: hypothetical protein QXR88_02800 [Candidatus Pacearchaeota archaeon]